jgi:hypothetical protein
MHTHYLVKTIANSHFTTGCCYLWYFICHLTAMKNILIPVFLVFVFCTASKCQQDPVIREIEMSKVSRGYAEHIRIGSDSLHVLIENRKGNKPGESYSRKITPDEWTSLVNTIRNVKLKDIPALTSPTMKRASDGAMHATLTVYTTDEKSYSHGYDDENPNDILKPLHKIIRELVHQ